MSKVQALVPLKDLVEAKTRLAGLLSPSQRRALAQAMAEDVLQVLAHHPQIDAITLVSDDPGAALLAERYGARCWPESALECRGLNAIVQCASERLLAGTDDRLLVLHADLPLLEQADISAVLQALDTAGGMVLGCDLSGEGTNLLAFSAASMPQFAFGPGSCAAHREWAQSTGVAFTLLRRKGIATDVDEARDLALLLDTAATAPIGKTAALLHGTSLGVRLQLALPTLLDAACRHAGQEELSSAGNERDGSN